jgi:hypothetical protein
MILAGLVASSMYAQEPVQTKSKKESKHEKKNERRQRLNELSKHEEEGEIVYNKQSVFSFKLATDGYGLGYEVGKFKSNRKSILFNFEFLKKNIRKKREKDFLIRDNFV